MSNFGTPDSILLSRIFLLHSNPRHEPFDSEAEAITYLCEKEDVYSLARDVVKFGLNPIELCGVIPADKKKTGGTFFVAEGNRRICALKLLSDPELAPPKYRKQFAKLAEGWTPVKTVTAVKFEDIETIRIWLDRIHNGAQGGIGRRQWNAEQKARFDGGNKNKASQALLDYAEQVGMITPEQREGKLTTVQRFLSNQTFRESLGFDQDNPEQPSRTRPKEDFDTILKRFVRDLVGKEDVNSRMNKEDIVKYARPLNNIRGLTGNRIDSEPLNEGASAGKTKATRKKKPKKPEKAKHVQYEEEIFQALKGYGNKKLESLYHSICDIELEHHSPLIAVGMWSFFETLTGCQGRKDGTDFHGYLAPSKLSNMGIVGKTTALSEALKRISQFGNTTKHHAVLAAFAGDQLNNDMTALKDVVLKCVDDASNKAP
ncbi:MAG: hypothetical protein HC843_06890 [Sphingomonadales bacterium]|nr:hypothetical protein [Sphingomonadales bacterium]